MKTMAEIALLVVAVLGVVGNQVLLLAPQ